MGDHVQRAEDFENQAEKKLSSWAIFGSKYEGASELFDKAANAYKLGKSWDRAGAAYVKLANCHLRLDSKHEAANSYADAGHCYKKIVIKEAIICLGEAVNLFLDIGHLNMSGRYYKEIAELYEQEQNLEHAIGYYEKAADLFQSEDSNSGANQFRLKVAQFASQLEQYAKAIEIYEDIARQSLNNNLVKYGVKGHLLNAGICQLCKSDVVAINNALERDQELDHTFSGSREYRLLAVFKKSFNFIVTSFPIQVVCCKSSLYSLLQDLAAAVDEEDVEKFVASVKEYDSMTQVVCLCRIN